MSLAPGAEARQHHHPAHPKANHNHSAECLRDSNLSLRSQINSALPKKILLKGPESERRMLRPQLAERSWPEPPAAAAHARLVGVHLVAHGLGTGIGLKELGLRVLFPVCLQQAPSFQGLSHTSPLGAKLNALPALRIHLVPARLRM